MKKILSKLIMFLSVLVLIQQNCYSQTVLQKSNFGKKELYKQFNTLQFDLESENAILIQMDLLTDSLLNMVQEYNPKFQLNKGTCSYQRVINSQILNELTTIFDNNVISIIYEQYKKNNINYTYDDLGTKDGISYRDAWESYHLGGTCLSSTKVLVVGYSTTSGDKYGGADWAFKLPDKIKSSNQLKSVTITVYGDRCDYLGSNARLTIRKNDGGWLDNVFNPKLSNNLEYNTFSVPSQYVEQCVMNWNNGLYLMPIITSEDNYNIRTVKVVIEYEDPQPKLCINENVKDFGEIPFGNNPVPNTFTFTVTNCGEGTLTGEISSSKGWISFNPPTFDLVGNGTETITVTATTSNLSTGFHSANIKVTTNAEQGANWIAVEVIIKEDPTIIMSVNPTSIDFGDVKVGESKTMSITIYNSSNSNEDLAISPTSPISPFEILDGQSLVIQPGSSKTFNIKFTPTNDQSYSQNFNITNNATNASNPYSVPMSGKGIDPTVIIMTNSPSNLDFGDVNVGESKTKSITIYNSSLSNDDLAISPTPPTSPFEILDGQSLVIQPGSSKTFNIKFTPTNDQSYSQNFNITNNATNASNPYSVLMSGKGVEPKEYDVTIITHGFKMPVLAEPIEAWMVPMGKALIDRIGKGSIWLYNKETGNFDTTKYAVGNGGEQILLFDWKQESNNATNGWSEAAGDALFTSLIKGKIEGKWNLDNIHFIGHSRGTVVNSEAVERLLAHGFSVDHVTNLDPHDWGGGSFLEFANDYDVNDFDVIKPTNHNQNSGVVYWSGIGMADNYYQEGEGQILDGRYVDGAYNKRLSYGSSLGHSELPIWYMGTIDYSYGLSIWYGDNQGDRMLSGFNYTRYGGISMMDTASFSHEVEYNKEKNGIVNGDFENTGALLLNSIPGWDLHGGGGNGDVILGRLRLDDSNTWLRHNRLYIPLNAKSIKFKYKISNKDGGYPPEVDKLQVLLGNDIIVDNFWLNYTTSNFIDYEFEVPSIYLNTVTTITFNLSKGESWVINSEVLIDDIEFGMDENIAPIMPFNPIPNDSDIVTTQNITLSWNCSDPDGDDDNMYYDVYLRKSGNTFTKYTTELGVNQVILNLENDSTTYDWYVTAYDEHGASKNSETWSFTVVDTLNSIKELLGIQNIPKQYYLSQNYPNPFNPTTTISFGLPEQSTVSLQVFDVLGKVVEELLQNEYLSAGTYNYSFNAKNLASGIYFYRLQTNNGFVETKKLILMK